VIAQGRGCSGSPPFAQAEIRLYNSNVSTEKSFWLSPDVTVRDLASHIDHTLLSPLATPSQIEKLAQEAATLECATACVNSSYVKLASQTGIKVAATIGFPLGAASTAAKVTEAIKATEDGASEIDMVIALGQLRGGNPRMVADDISAVRRSTNALLKVILETAMLSANEMVSAARIAVDCGADFLKTSTGFNGPGASVSDVIRLVDLAGGKAKVKASGGIKTLETARFMLDAGASRLGCSATVSILRELKESNERRNILATLQ
jgi:deoxyribose-phosphate aldolase